MALSAGTVAAILTLNTDQFDQGISAAQQTLQGLNSDNATVGQKVAAIGESAAEVGTTLTRSLTLPGLLLGRQVIQTYTDYDDAMRRVAATTEATVSEQEQLDEAARKAGENTRFKASEAADALNYLALAGYTADEAIAALPTVLTAASAGSMDLARASDLITDGMNALGIGADDMMWYVDILARGAQKANTTVEQLGDAALTVGANGRQLKGGVTELATALSILADNGYKGSEGGIHLRNMLASLTNAVDESTGAVDKYGLKVYDSEGNMRSFADILSDLSGIMAQMNNDLAVDTMLQDIFNVRDTSSVRSLIDAVNSGRWDELTGFFETANGTAQQMADTMEAGIGGASRELTSAVESLQLALGEGLQPTVTSLIESVTELARGFAGMDEDTRSTIVNVGLIAVAAGPVLTGAGKIMTAVGTIATKIEGIAAAAGSGGALSAAFLGEAGFFALFVAAAAGALAIIEDMDASMERVKKTLAGDDSGEAEIARRGFEEGLAGNGDQNRINGVLTGQDVTSRGAGEAMGALTQEGQRAMLAARQQAEQQVETAKAALDRAIDAATTGEEVQAAHAAYDKTVAEIEASQEAAQAEVRTNTIEGWQEVFAGIAKAYPEQAQTLYDAVTELQGRQLLKQGISGDALGLSDLSEGVKAALMENFDDVIQEIESGEISGDRASSLITQMLQETFGGVDAEAVISGLQGTVFGSALTTLLESEIADEISGIDLAGPESLLLLVTGNLRQTIGSEMQTAGNESASLFTAATAEGISSSGGRVTGNAKSMGSNAASGARSGGLNSSTGYSMGAALGSGAARGIRSQIAVVSSAARQLATSAQSVFTAVNEIHSPSRVFRRYGQFIGQGLVLGLEDSAFQTERAMEKLVGAPSMNGRGAASSAYAGAGTVYNINLNNPQVKSEDDAKDILRRTTQYRKKVLAGRGG